MAYPTRVRRVLFLLVVASGLRAQSAEEIAAKAIDAMGGTARFATIESIKMEGRLRLGQGEFTPFSMVARRPAMFRLELSVGPDRVTQAYDGTIGWQSVSGEHNQEPTPLTGDSLAHLIDQASTAIGGPLLDLKKRHNKAELLGRETLNGADCYKVKITFSTGNSRVMFIDSANFREVQEEMPAQVNGATTIEQEVSQYRRFDGILVACLLVTREKGGPDSQRMEIDSVELNPALDEGLFKLPWFKLPAKKPR
jgi:hypothetical protein